MDQWLAARSFNQHVSENSSLSALGSIDDVFSRREGVAFV